jgi:anti-sigma factor ChrR (cupin superfamily)
MTQAVTPNAPQHAALPPLASRFVDVAALPWVASARYPGCESKVLLLDRNSGSLTMLMRMAPGARLPDHEHVQIEQTFVLQGSLACGEGECNAGDFVWRPAGSRHEAWAGARGALILGIFQIPNRFFDADGKVRDFTGNDWEQAWGAAQARWEQSAFTGS